MNTEQSSKAVFDAYAVYYDLLYKDKDYAAEADYVHRLIQRHAPGAKRILELGSGTGKHARLLAGKGYVVRGVERSEVMLARAREALEGDAMAPVFTQGDIRDIRLPEKFDAVISLFHVMSYMTSDEDVHAALATARAHISGGGLFVFDCWYGPAVLTLRPSVRVKRMENEQCRLTRLAEPTLLWRENCVNVHYDVFVESKRDGSIRHLQEDHRMRYFSEPELRGLLALHGFDVLGISEWLTDRAPADESWGVCLVCRGRE